MAPSAPRCSSHLVERHDDGLVGRRVRSQREHTAHDLLLVVRILWARVVAVLEHGREHAVDAERRLDDMRRVVAVVLRLRLGLKRAVVGGQLERRAVDRHLLPARRLHLLPSPTPIIRKHLTSSINLCRRFLKPNRPPTRQHASSSLKPSSLDLAPPPAGPWPPRRQGSRGRCGRRQRPS
eukprot:3534622-Rhodomonas_salina.3